MNPFIYFCESNLIFTENIDFLFLSLLTMKNVLITCCLFCFTLPPLFSKITLPELFSDNMVLQQQTDAPIWGKATPKKTVTVHTSWNNQTYSTQADENGKWQLKVKTPQAGGPYTITISGEKKLTLNNVLIGEVWICSGQSNMEMEVAGFGKVLNHEQEILAANYPNIRLLHVEKNTSPQPLEGFKTRDKWQICSPATIADFSAVGYFFGRNLFQQLNIPIGLISTSWGGTVAEAWTSGESLELMPDFKKEVQTIKSRSMDEAIAAYEKEKKQWDSLVSFEDKGFSFLSAWADARFDVSTWSNMQLPNLWENAGLPDFDGTVWFRKTIDIPGEWQGKELQLRLAMVDDEDITYFNGIQIGATSGHNVKRIYTIPGKLVKAGKSTIIVRVSDTGGGGGIYGGQKEMDLSLSKNAQSTIIPLAGNWQYFTGLNYSKFPKAPRFPKNEPNIPTVLYNAMIHPLVPFSIKGAIWYQGESNADKSAQYRDLFPLMIHDWRKQWNSDFPFYFVQLANYMEEKPEPQHSNWPLLREAQLQTLRLDNTGMAVTIDIGDAQDIHPRNKQDVGKRLALNALAKTYGKQIIYSGPIFDSYQLEGDKIRIRFQHADGLKAKTDNKLTGFAIAGPDHKFYWADAVIEGKDVVVSSSNVSFPVAVRYAWADNPVCNLYNSADLPASPFRTDNW